MSSHRFYNKFKSVSFYSYIYCFAAHGPRSQQCSRWLERRCHRGLLMLQWALLWLPGSGRFDEVQQWDRSYWTSKWWSDCANICL